MSLSNNILNETARDLQNDWELQLPEIISREAILMLLAERVMLLLDRNAESFFQLMYRLDIPEKKLILVLHDADGAEKIAGLIYERQLQKIQSRHENKQDKDDDPELMW